MAEAFGVDPTEKDTIDVPIDDRLKKTWTHWIRKGQTEQSLEALLSIFETPEFLKTPELNSEVDVLLVEKGLQMVRTRDKYCRAEQDLTSAAIVSSAAVIAAIMEGIKSMEDGIGYKLIRLMQDVVKILTHLFYEQSEARKSYILPSIEDKKYKALLENQESDLMLFGSNLPEKMKTLKNAISSAKEIAKPPPAKKPKVDFLSQVGQHPSRNNLPFSGQGSQRGRKTFNKSRGQGFQFQRQPKEKQQNKK